jgi:hypothetical protein
MSSAALLPALSWVSIIEGYRHPEGWRCQQKNRRGMDRAPNTPHDILRAADEALDLPDRGERGDRLVALLERAVNACREQGDERGDYAYLIPILEQRVRRAIEGLRAYLRGPEYPDRPHGRRRSGRAARGHPPRALGPAA